MIAARIHMTISTRSFAAKANAYPGLRKSIRYEARKLVVMERVLISRFLVLKAERTK